MEYIHWRRKKFKQRIKNNYVVHIFKRNKCKSFYRVYFMFLITKETKKHHNYIPSSDISTSPDGKWDNRGFGMLALSADAKRHDKKTKNIIICWALTLRKFNHIKNRF